MRANLSLPLQPKQLYINGIMKRLVLSLAAVVCSLLSFAQTNQMVWNNGRMQYAQPITNIDSLTYHLLTVESDTMQFILPRATRHVVHDTVTLHDTITLVRRDTVNIVKHDTIFLYEGALQSAFSVADGKQVCFSKGNLQFIQSIRMWRFADHQYDMIGEANIKNSALADTIDLFGWSGNNTTAPWGISISTDNADYSGDFVDWGRNFGNTWRTLTMDEWVYLIETRTDASSKWGIACIYLNADSSQYVNGMILLPDTWTCPMDITFKSGKVSKYGAEYYAGHQTFTLSQWQLLEQAGAVFLPAAGIRIGENVSTQLSDGSYRSSIQQSGSKNAYHFYFSSDYVQANISVERHNGQSVRLVHDL